MQRNPKTVLITGAGSGIGAALATEAAHDGWRVILVGRRHEKLVEVTSALPRKADPICVNADITQPEGRALVREACEKSGGVLDMLINNAGVVSVGSMQEVDDGEIAKMLDTNLAAPIALTRELLPLLRRSPSARVVNVGSMFGNIAFPMFGTYSATKFGLRGFSDALRRELAGEGIAVTYAAPRAVKTPAADVFESLIVPFQMKLDAPKKVGRRIWKQSLKGKRSIYPPGPERVFLMLQRLFPKLIDGGLVRQYEAYRTG